ncbi:hypothetical protein BpHYR1_016847 [Brachionus plicatilis]|uniref:Uncharacterized protein n=1 Tax=Brachionus plicatilis TaxID=10195 RepID=A0A3M7P5D8_BRAPC|nr:hypothetical protein BpHYR1_016847 [Brachionus plicatilis]
MTEFLASSHRQNHTFRKSNFYLFQLDDIYLLWHNQNDTKIYSFHILWNSLSKHLNKLDKNNIWLFSMSIY